jgi:hypothetical protein
MEFQIEQAKENRKRKVKFEIADFRSQIENLKIGNTLAL